MTSVSTIVLAGGLSARMGQDKALLKIQGVPLLQRTIDRVLPMSQVVFVVTAWPERYSFVQSSCQLVSDRFTDGPLVGFVQGLSMVQTDWVMLLSCDLPNLNRDIVTQWIKHLAAVPSDVIAYLPQGEKGWEPLCGFYRSTCLDSLQKFIKQGGRSFQRWLQNQSVEVLPVNDRRILFNCNTPEDWLHVQKTSQA